MAEFDAPSYDQDEQDGVGSPPGAKEFRRRLEASDAFVISAPEYNAAMPGLLKNAIDWVSWFRPQPFNERHALQELTKRQAVRYDMRYNNDTRRLD